MPGILSPFLLAKQLENQVRSALALIDLQSLPKAEQELAAALKRNLDDARLDARDYELSETRQEQLRNARQGKARLEASRKQILGLSEYNVFGPADVAQLTARLEQIIDNLQ